MRNKYLLFVNAFLFTFLCAVPGFAAWSYLGPDNIGGRTRALIIDPTDPTILYTATYNGGVWKSTNSGATWQPVGDSLPNMAIGVLTMDPSDADTLYAGTTGGTTGAVPGGIFRTSNGGTSWTHLTATDNSSFSAVSDIVVSPLNPSRIYAAVGLGVMQTTDGGSNWSQILSPELDTGCQDLAIRSDQANDYLFASCGSLDKGVRIYRNTAVNSSGIWNNVKTVNGISRAAMAIAPSNQDTAYAVFINFDKVENLDFHEGLYSVMQSTDGGGSWQARYENTFATNVLNNMLLSDSWAALCGSATMINHGLFSASIAVDPVDPSRVWVGGIDLFRSDNGGATWGLAAHSTAPSSNPRFSHADTHGIVFHPDYDGTGNKKLFVANDQGVFRTDDARAAVATGNTAPCNYENGSVNWTPLISGYGATEFQHGLPYPNGTTYFGGTHGNGTIRGSDAGGVAAWQQLLGSEGGYVALNPSNTAILYAENAGITIKKSTDGGTNFLSSISGIELNNNPDIGLPVTPFVMDPANPNRLWTGGEVLWRTSDAGASWVQASDIASKHTSSIAVSPLNSNRVIAGREGGFVMRSNSALTTGANTLWDSENIRTGFVSSVTFDRFNDDISYATYSTVSTLPGKGQVYKSTNGAVTFVKIDGDLPVMPVYSLATSPLDSNTLHIGTRLGVYTTTNGGTNWVREGTGMPDVSVKHVELLVAGGHILLYAFTEGRGLWKLDLGTIPSPPSVSITSPDTGSALSGTISIDADASDDTSVSKVEFYVDGNLEDTDNSDPYSISWDTTAESNGNHTLVARAYDNENNTKDSDPVPVIVVNGDPFVEITSPAHNATVGGIVTVTAGAYDDNGVTQVEFYYDGNLIDTDTTNPYSVSWDVSLLANGPYTLTAIVYDGDTNDFTSAPITANVSNGLYFDDFEDGNHIGWTSTKGLWGVNGGGDLTGTFNKKADIISGDFTALGGCSLCSVETYMRVDTAGGRASLLAFYVSKTTMVELAMMEDKDKWLLKQRANGTTVAKGKAIAPINPGVDYKVRLEHDGTKFLVYVDDVLLFQVNRGAVPSGTVGYRVKSTTGANVTCAFQEIRVE